jgi:hypothetical protein
MAERIRGGRTELRWIAGEKAHGLDDEHKSIASAVQIIITGLSSEGLFSKAGCGRSSVHQSPRSVL